MARLIDRLLPRQEEERSFPPGWLLGQLEAMNLSGRRYFVGGGTLYGNEEPTVHLGERNAYCENGVVAAVVSRRVALYSQALFRWKRLDAGLKPMATELFGTTALAPLDDPIDLLVEWETSNALAGNGFAVRDGDRVVALDPRWTSLVLGSMREPDDPAVAWDARPVGLIYQPPNKDAEVWGPGEFAHYAPRKDPAARFRGMSYLRPVLVESANTVAQNTFINRFYANGATPNLAVTFPPEVQKATVEAFRDLFLAKHEGATNAFRTAFIGGGADLKMIGANLSQLASKDINADQFARICAAAEVPPIVVTIVPGLESASTYANYATALRSFADLTVRPLWYRTAVKLRPLITPVPAGAELWYDVSHVSALQSDALDDAEIQAKQAHTMRTLVDGGFDPASVVSAVMSGDLTRLSHSGLVSVQLLPPGQQEGGQ